MYVLSIRYMQVGITIVAFEYERQRERRAAKKKLEAEENMARHEQARQEHEVNCYLISVRLSAFTCLSAYQPDSLRLEPNRIPYTGTSNGCP